MSGRYALFNWPEALGQLPGFPQHMRAHWNLAPKSQVLMLYQNEGQRHAALALWGFTSSWMTDLTRAVAHARAETVNTLPMFQNAWRKQRCLLPANGFFLSGAACSVSSRFGSAPMSLCFTLLDCGMSMQCQGMTTTVLRCSLSRPHTCVARLFLTSSNSSCGWIPRAVMNSCVRC